MNYFYGPEHEQNIQKKMKSDFAKQKLNLVVIIAIILLVLGAIFLFVNPFHYQLPVCQLYLEFFKTVVAGFVVAMLGILIPARITEARQNFEMLKESRIAYSKTKTGIDYLALRLSAAKFEEASEIIQTVHFDKHQAVLYDELEQHIQKRFGSSIDKDTWDDAIYRKLRNTRIILKQNASNWNDLTPKDRLALLRVALPDIDEVSNPGALKSYELTLQE